MKSKAGWLALTNDFICYSRFNEEVELTGTLAAIHDAASGVSGRSRSSSWMMRQRTRRRDHVSGRCEGDPNQSTPDCSCAERRRTRCAGRYCFFVDADTRINRTHVNGGMAALEGGYAGGSALVAIDGFVPIWGRMLLRGFSSVYFGLNLGAGAFLFHYSSELRCHWWIRRAVLCHW